MSVHSGASASVPVAADGQVAASVNSARSAWNRAVTTWSRDDCADAVATMKKGEAMMYAATDLQCAQGDLVDALVVALGQLVDADLTYSGATVVIPAANHSDAIARVAKARAVLSTARAL